eukprot:XP_015574147.1 lisH domain-containing protein C1711.05 isoform X1 [Ricinus communis]
MPKTQIGKTVEVNPSILAFKPRQVLLLSKPPASSMKLDDGSNNNDKLILKPEQKTLLLNSIAQYLERSGFSKTVKKFRSEARIQKDDLIESSFDLQEMFIKILDMRNHANKNSKSHRVQELQTVGISRTDGNGDFASATGDGKERKKDKSAVDKSIGPKNAEENPTPDNTMSTEVKPKEKTRNKKKQSNLGSESLCNNPNEESVSEPTVEKSKDVAIKADEKMTDSKTDDKPKDKKKKKKKNKLSSDPIVAEENLQKIDSENLKTPKEDFIEKQDKNSKKRKRTASEDGEKLIEDQPNGEKLVEVSKHIKTEESKRRKTKDSEEPKVRDHSTGLDSSSRIEEKPQKEENSQTVSGEAQKLLTIELNGQSNRSLKEIGEKSSMKKIEKQQNGSTEPQSAIRFQRVKVDDVVFSDERLKDNSYWAKDGAEIGYGAKAQDILGQVRGRDFRHEKTKKKRGSYRGGQIDLQSHSVKFNYSDDE